MKNWSDEFSRFLARSWGRTPDPDNLQQHYAWVTDLHARARELLDPQTLRGMDPPGIYARLRELSVPQCPIRVSNLGRENRAHEIVDALARLMETPGGFAEKYRAAKIPQAGVVTITELLCAAKPMRFVLRNTRFTRAAAKVIPFYSAKALKELTYADFLDLCMELARVMEDVCGQAGCGDWAREHRFLLLYAATVAG